MQDHRERWEAAVHGIFAGNIFDMVRLIAAAARQCRIFGDATSLAVKRTMLSLESALSQPDTLTPGRGGVSFYATRSALLPRPWVIDDLDAFLDALMNTRYRKAVFFVDNAGADVFLGVQEFFLFCSIGFC